MFQTPDNAQAAHLTLDWGNVIAGIIGGMVGVVITLVAEFFIRRYEKSKDKEEQTLVVFKNQTRKIDGSIYRYLGPGSSVEMMKSDLGPPNRQYGTDAGLFTEELHMPDPDPSDPETQPEEYEPAFTAYLYFFENAHVKLISRDGVSIDALTIIALSNTVPIPDDPDAFLNRYKIDEAFFGTGRIKAEHFPGCTDTLTAICSMRYSFGFSQVITYFCEDFSRDFYEPDLEKNPKELIGATAYGVCVSNKIDTVSYIYLSEID